MVGDEVYSLQTVDHGQVVGYAGDDPVETAVNGVLRVGSHAKYGFGEFRVRPAESDRVPGRSGVPVGGAAMPSESPPSTTSVADTSASDDEEEDEAGGHAAGQAQPDSDAGGGRR